MCDITEDEQGGWPHVRWGRAVRWVIKAPYVGFTICIFKKRYENGKTGLMVQFVISSKNYSPPVFTFLYLT